MINKYKFTGNRVDIDKNIKKHFIDKGIQYIIENKRDVGNNVEIIIIVKDGIDYSRNIKMVDCSLCENNNTAWCGDCEHRQNYGDNYDFYRPMIQVI